MKQLTRQIRKAASPDFLIIGNINSSADKAGFMQSVFHGMPSAPSPLDKTGAACTKQATPEHISREKISAPYNAGFLGTGFAILALLVVLGNHV